METSREEEEAVENWARRRQKAELGDLLFSNSSNEGEEVEVERKGQRELVEGAAL
jgi:hypothetical protein